MQALALTDIVRLYSIASLKHGPTRPVVFKCECANGNGSPIFRVGTCDHALHHVLPVPHPATTSCAEIASTFASRNVCDSGHQYAAVAVRSISASYC